MRKWEYIHIKDTEKEEQFLVMEMLSNIRFREIVTNNKFNNFLWR